MSSSWLLLAIYDVMKCTLVRASYKIASHLGIRLAISMSWWMQSESDEVLTTQEIDLRHHSAKRVCPASFTTRSVGYHLKNIEDVHP